MENASRALLIAGGVLLSLLVIGALLMLTNMLSANARDAEELREQRQIADFNSRFEAFNRRLLTGQDVISLINMAIDNNNRPDFDEGSPMFINVILTVNREFNDYEEIMTTYRDGRVSGPRRVQVPRARQILQPGIPHSLIRNFNPERNLMNAEMDRDFLELFNRPLRPITRSETRAGNYVMITEISALSEFRNASFESVPGGITYNNRRKNNTN